MKKTIGFPEMSSHNRFTILNLIREQGTISRADLVKTTTLTAPSVSRITADLMEQGLIMEDGIGDSTGGRKPVLYRFNPDARYAIAVAIVRERLDFGLLDFSPRILESKSVPLVGAPQDPKTIEAIIRMISEYIESLNKYRDKLIGAGISIPGLIDLESGAVRYSSPMGWHNVDLKRRLHEKTDIPLHIDNSIMAMTIAENMFGKRRKSKNFIYLYAGMGIGIGIVINGLPYKGTKYSSMEVGHTVLSIDGAKCACGKRGCWEALAGTPSLLERYVGKTKSRIKLQGQSGVEHLAAQYAAGSMDAIAAVDETLHFLAVGLSNLVNIFNPQHILLSGWPLEFPDSVMEKIKKRVIEYSMEGMGELLHLERCSFKHDDELLYGAGAIALHEFMNVGIAGRRR